jgi:PTS system nitrogen regulatory IIA component
VQLTVRDVAKLLGVGESTVTRWIKQRGLPAQWVGNQHRFNRAELLEWATANQIKVSLDLFDHLEKDAESPPSLVEALEAGGIFHKLPDSNQEKALRALVQVLPLPDGIDRELLLRLFLAREMSATTAIGDGIALPHVRNPIVLNVDRPMVTLCFLERPVEFGALDGKPVHVLFSLVCPTVRTHLQMLARLSHSFHDKDFKEALMRQAQPAQILRELRRIEASLSTNCSAAGKGAR